ncbi:concanavalin A-like lectin/glucanase domain-containing protein [Boletus coccyginus]|nr:concanavalin A-like lectin/glucanase domain-containing protein [Boletus coccyginus]
MAASRVLLAGWWRLPVDSQRESKKVAFLPGPNASKACVPAVWLRRMHMHASLLAHRSRGSWYRFTTCSGRAQHVRGGYIGSQYKCLLAARANSYALEDWYQGDGFFSGWSFFTGADPTHGNVNYLGQQDAQNQGLAYVGADNTFVLAVDSWSAVPAGGNRNSVRISSNKVYSSGLIILDALAMPVGCGTWPAFWTVGPNWPTAGEIDIIEGVNNGANNQMTLHSGTSNQCTLDESKSFTGEALGTDCYSSAGNDLGCSILDTDMNSFGYGFNGGQGGVFALQWDNSYGMSMWRFARDNIPQDITNQTPDPASWGEPTGFWSAATCDIGANFYSHTLVFDTTICGDWAGAVYGTSGCPGTCSDMVANAANFADAKWVINYVAVYQ